MNYVKIYQTNITDGPGVRVSLYVSGCRNHCEGCHNKETWDFNIGKKFTTETIDKICHLMERPYIHGLTLCGGEPMEEENQRELINLVRRVRSEFPDKTIWSYTGYELSDLLPGGKKHTSDTEELIKNIDILITGRFEINKLDTSSNNIWRGSTNQRVLKARESYENNKAVYLEALPNNN